MRIKERRGGHVTVVMATSVDASKTLREALAMGADRGVMLKAGLLEDSDTLAISFALAHVIKKLGSYDLIICGEASEDSGAAQVGPSLAEWLSIPHIAYVRQLKIDDSRVVAEKKLERLIQTVECEMPLVVTVLREINEPRMPTTLKILRVPREHMLTWSLEDAGLASAELLMQPSAVRVNAVEPIIPSRKSAILEGKPEEMASELAGILLQQRLIPRKAK